MSKPKPPPTAPKTHFPQVPLDDVKKAISPEAPEKNAPRLKNVVKEVKTEPYTTPPRMW
jgi:hypothetical protein